MRIWAVLVFAVVFAPLSALGEEIPAEPRWKGAPDYPATCLSPAASAVDEERVDVAFTINDEGLTENVRIMRSTNSCFEEAALSAVRSWVYEPRRVNGRRRPQEDMEATFIFEFREVPPDAESNESNIEATTRALVFDAQPIKRLPPRYPDRCFDKSFREERVVVEFDVNFKGETENYRVIDSTNGCFNSSALSAVKRWRYEPRTIDGIPTDRVGVQTLIIFKTDFGKIRPENVIRPVVARRLNRARRHLQKEEAEEALALLEEFESEFGDSLSPAELAEFHRMRGIARLNTKDYEGALDDLRTAKRLNSLDPGDSLQSIIDQLEAALGVSSGEETTDETPASEPSSE